VSVLQSIPRATADLGQTGFPSRPLVISLTSTRDFDVNGGKLCHFQDLLAPLSSKYSGMIKVHDAEEERRLETAD
jgi:hypothetical protein